MSTSGTGLVHQQMSGWGLYSAAFDFHTGYVGIYAPNSSVATQLQNVDRTNGYALSAFLPPISGEPTASLYDGYGIFVGSSPPLAIPLLTQHDGPDPLNASELLSACLSELDRSGSNDVFGQTFDFSAKCINLGRVVGGLGDQTTFRRMVEGWLAVHSFVAREGLEERKMSDALGASGIGASGAASITAPEMERLVGTLESGLAFVVALATSPYSGFVEGNQQVPPWEQWDYRVQKIATPCNSDSDCNPSSNNPGYRCDMGVSPHVCRVPYLTEAPQHQQKLGVPYFALQTAASYLKVLGEYLKQVAAQTFGAPADNSPSSARQTALAHYSAGMRMVFFIEQWANAVNQAADVDTQAGTCPGNPNDCTVIAKQFNAEVRELETLRAVAMAAAQAMHDQRNPFNIPENDVPLFFGDPAGVNSQYFASSDYLLHGWALPAINQAQNYLDAARGSWILQSQSAVQDEFNQHNRKQEVDQLCRGTDRRSWPTAGTCRWRTAREGPSSSTIPRSCVTSLTERTA